MCGASEETEDTPLHHSTENSHGSLTVYTVRLMLFLEKLLKTVIDYSFTRSSMMDLMRCQGRDPTGFHLG